MKFPTVNFLLCAVFLPLCVNSHAEKNKNLSEQPTLPQLRRTYENGTEACDLCVMFGGTLLEDVYPNYDFDYLPQGLNCAELSELFHNEISDKSDQACYVNVTEFHYDCCWFPVSTVQCEQKIQSMVTGDDSEYSSNVEPLPVNETKLNVYVSYGYFGLTDINTMEGTAEVYISVSMSWRDERLAWEPKDHGGCFRTIFRASNDPELTDIWVPSFDLYNRASSLQDMPSADATATSKGDVIWTRFGALKALCWFKGLERFPYDELVCDFEFRSTNFYYERVQYVLENFAFSEQQIGERKYQEFSLIYDRTTATVDNLGFVFKRSSRYYTSKIVIPTILFTILSFGVFLLDQRVGERLGFGVSMLLVIVAQAILTSDMLPVTKERLWINTLTQGSQYFSIAAVMESVFVAYLHFAKVDKFENNENESTADDFVENNGERVSFLDESNGQPNSIDDENVNNVSLSEQAKDPRNDRGDEDSSPTEEMSFVSKVKNFRWTARSIRKLDRVCLVVFPIAYIIFITAMFATL
eukprot:CAMPEP_0185726224 /NCGR_PEP_ID=MMETSP1171-20130828/2269_1 /TAXON_ID=374046 /ORGANISM="Helicotheca tamensis, Strain CCMP826" /LENGTH=525 /DNA_ID=CAMNT_0028394537 /DNA_START=198 /DNA_END=1775 /DNA_ORIENTATION=+